MEQVIHSEAIQIKPIFTTGREILPVNISCATEKERFDLLSHYQGIVAMTGSTVAEEQLAMLRSTS